MCPVRNVTYVSGRSTSGQHPVICRLTESVDCTLRATGGENMPAAMSVASVEKELFAHFEP
jgi:hypothetical protein